ncbi:MAG: CapA family protein [Lachnospiraceae bacterium]|nr:CapA family protein [Lachnospiraceae bacterium]
MRNDNRKKISSKAEKIIIADIILALLLLITLILSGVTGKAKKSSSDADKAAANSQIEYGQSAANDTIQDGVHDSAATQAEENGIAAEQAEAERIAAQQAEAERIAAEQAQAEVTVRLTMAGDYLLNGIVNNNCITEYGYDYNGIFQNVAPYLTGYDLKIINEETPCGGAEYGISGYPTFNSPHEAQDAIANAGFNLVCLATNHMLDMGTDPLCSTLNYWREAYPWMLTVGAYDSQEASDQLCYYEKDGFRIAVLNYTYDSNAGSGIYYDAPFCLNMLEEESVRQDIQLAKQTSDYVIVCPHWGTEYLLDYDDYQYEWAQIFLQEGVDLVLGTHSHCPEPIEIYTRDDGHQMICYYSLGNFISGQENAFSLVGCMADVTLRKTAQGVVVDDYGIVPIVTHKSPYYFSTYLLKDYSDEMIYSGSDIYTDPEFSWGYCTDLVTSMYGDRLRNF